MANLSIKEADKKIPSGCQGEAVFGFRGALVIHFRRGRERPQGTQRSHSRSVCSINLRRGDETSANLCKEAECLSRCAVFALHARFRQQQWSKEKLREFRKALGFARLSDAPNREIAMFMLLAAKSSVHRAFGQVLLANVFAAAKH